MQLTGQLVFSGQPDQYHGIFVSGLYGTDQCALSLRSIGSYAFDGSFQGSPATIDLSGCANLTTIGPRAFYNCNRLTDVALPSGLNTIGQGAFAGSGLVRADWADLVNLATLDQEAFMGCGDLIYVDLTGTGLTSIETNTFYGCTGLETIYLPDGMTTIANNTFQYCTSLRAVTMPASLTTHSTVAPGLN